MNAEEIRRAAVDVTITKREFINTLREELYRVPFRAADDAVYVVKVEAVGKNVLEVHLSDESVFSLTVK